MALDAGKVVAYLTLDTSKFESGIATGRTLLKTLQKEGLFSQKGIMALGEAAASTGKLMTLGLTAPIAGLGTAAVKTFMSFDDAMREVIATMEATEEESKRLTEAAQEIGLTTQFSATKAANALNSLAAAGYDTEKAIAAMPTVLKLSAAAGIELGSAADMLTDSMSALGLGVADMETYVDQLAKGANVSNASIAQLGEGILTVGGTAKMLKGGTVELAAALGVLANNGLKGAEGGTMLRNILNSLASPTDKAAEKIKKVGLRAYDAQGNFRGLNEIFADLAKIMDGWNDQKRNDLLSEIFNVRDLKAAEALLASTTGLFQEFADEIADSDGAAQAFADTLSGGLSGSMDRLKAAIEGLAIEFGEDLAPTVMDVAEWVTELTRSWARLDEGTQQTIITVAKWVAGAGPVFVVLGKLITGVTALATALSGPVGLITLGVVGVGALAGALALLPGEIDAVDAALARVDVSKVEDFKRGLEKGEAKITVDLEARVPSATSIYDKIFAALTDGKPDTKKQKQELQAEVQAYYDGLVSEINLNTEAQLENLKQQLEDGFISMEEYQTRANAISTENGILIENVQKTCADSLAYVSQMSGKSTEEVQASLGKLEDLKARAAALKAEVESMIRETESAEAKQAQLLVKAGVKVDEETIGLAFSSATGQAKVEMYQAEEKAKGKRKAADMAFSEDSKKNGITDAELEALKADHDAKVAQIEADLEADKARVQASLLQNLNELFAGLASGDGALQEQLATAFESLDLWDALRTALDTGEFGSIMDDPAIMERLGKALKIDDPAALLKGAQMTEGLAGVHSLLEYYAQQLMSNGSAGAGGLDASPMGAVMRGLIEQGILDGLNFDEANVRDKLALALGKLNLPESVAAAMKQAVTGGAATGDGSSGGDTAVSVPVEIKPEPKVEDAPAAIKEAVEESVAPTGEEGSAAVSVSVPVSVAPDASVEDGAGSKVVDAVTNSIISASSRAKSAGDSLGRAVVVAFRGQIGSAKTAGRDMVQGLINGAEDKRASLISKFESLMLAAIRAAKQKAGIASPSKVFRAIGNNIADSFALGVDERMATSQQTLERLVGVPSSARTSPTAQPVFDYDRLAAATSRPVYLYVDSKLLAQATATENTRAVAERQRRLDIGKGLI